MTLELNLRFPRTNEVIVSFEGEDSGTLPFTDPLIAKDRKDLQWYLEVYGAHSLGAPDDAEAARIAAQLPVWGKALFDAVFGDRAAQRLFNDFQDRRDDSRLLTISAEQPAILSLPWELLHDSAKGGVHLFLETPRISIRRRMAGATGGRAPFRVKSKDRLHLLFVVSRPEGAGFIDPRADAQAVLDALARHTPGRVTWEFLRPPTLDALVRRLEDAALPPVDILHFDGHGVFDCDGGLPEAVAQGKQHSFSPLQSAASKDQAVTPAAGSPANTGYLLFEDATGKMDLVSAQQLGENLHRHEVALVILSACQSAALGDTDEPLGSVAVRLTATGIPAVLAMTHSVLVATTRALFEEFYENLAKCRGIGEALDNARRYLKNHPEKYQVQRGSQRVPLKLYDWFLPALYQSGADVPLIKKAKDKSPQPEAAAPCTNLPPRPEAGFFGRRRELWDIERGFADQTRRITLTGFGGQGKTALAEEAGRWLTRTGLFQAAVILRYNEIPSGDAVGVAVSTLGSVLGESLIDADAATAALRKTATLVILDNLEAVAPEPLRQLLDAAVSWSEAGGSRVLCTTRTPDFNHPHYRVEGTRIHRRIALEGLGHHAAPDDALEWFAELQQLPPAPSVPSPAREALVELFDRVRFHPLSIRVLAQQLKTRRPAELGQRLEQLLTAGSAVGAPAATDDTPPELVASLQLSLDRLDDTARQVLPRLGVFQGGAWEPVLLKITEIGEAVWPVLRAQLEAAALLEAEPLLGVLNPFLRFHPTLAPLLWAQLNADEQARLSAAHRQRYYNLIDELYHVDDQAPSQARAVAWQELPNLLHAVHAALAAGETDAVDYADYVNRFLYVFGLQREAETLIAQAQAAAGETGSQAWVLAQSNRGEQLYSVGRVAEAVAVFHAVLEALGDTPSERQSLTLNQLGRCFLADFRPDLAAQHQRAALAVLDRLEPTYSVKQLRGICLVNLANALVNQGHYAEARRLYADGLAISETLGDFRGQALVLNQVGVLALLEGGLDEAKERHRAALALFQQLQEPAMEAVAWH